MDYYPDFSEFDDFADPGLRWSEGFNQPPPGLDPTWSGTGSASIATSGEHGFSGLDLGPGPGQLFPQAPLSQLNPSQIPDHGFHPSQVPVCLPSQLSQDCGVPPSQDPVQMIAELQIQVNQLKRENEVLDARYNVLFSAYNALLRRIPAATNFQDTGTLQRSDFPLVKFWYKQEWTEFCKKNKEPADPQVALRGSARSHMGINVMMRYVQDRHGSVIDGFAASMMRSLARAIWVELGISGAAPNTWGQADMESRNGYYRAMNAGFFELRLCDGNWKADQIATDYYSGWYGKWRAYLQVCSFALPAEVKAPPKAGPSIQKKKASKRRKFKGSDIESPSESVLHA